MERRTGINKPSAYTKRKEEEEEEEKMLKEPTKLLNHSAWATGLFLLNRRIYLKWNNIWRRVLVVQDDTQCEIKRVAH